MVSQMSAGQVSAWRNGKVTVLVTAFAVIMSARGWKAAPALGWVRHGLCPSCPQMCSGVVLVLYQQRLRETLRVSNELIL